MSEYDRTASGNKAGKVIVTGANGQLGKEFQQLVSSFPFEFIFLTKDDLSINQPAEVKKIFREHQPQYLINCAAYTAVDKAENEKDIAFQVNAAATGELAAMCKEQHAKFIHISTDYVFDGSATVPYRENDLPNPQGVYGASKSEGEKLAVKNNPESIIIRTSWLYSSYGKNFVKTMMRLMSEKEEINVVNDQFGSPTYAPDLAAAIMQIVSFGKWVPGIYHYSNEGIISWHDFAVAIKELTGSTCKINPITTAQYPTTAKRPAYSVLDKTKIQTTFGISIRGWKDGLAVCIQRLSSH